MHCSTEDQKSLLFSVIIFFWLCRAAPFFATVTAAIPILLIVSTAPHLVVLHSPLTTSNDRLSRRLRPRHALAPRFSPQNLSSRRLLLHQHRAFYHLVPTEHSSVVKLLQARLPCALGKLSSSNIFHLTCYNLVHCLQRREF